MKTYKVMRIGPRGRIVIKCGMAASDAYAMAADWEAQARKVKTEYTYVAVQE